MDEIIELTTRPLDQLFFKHHDRQDVRLGEIVSPVPDDLSRADIVIVGCPQDAGIERAGGPAGAAAAPNAIREHFYKLSNFGIHKRIVDLGDIRAGATLEETLERLAAVAEHILATGKRLIVIGGGGELAHPNAKAMAAVFGSDHWIGINVDPKFDFASREELDSESAFRRIIEDGLLLPRYLYEIAFQPHCVSPVHYRQLIDIDAKIISLQLMRSRDAADTELRETIRQEFIHHSRTMNVFFNFDMQSVRASEAPGVTHPNPFGLRAGEFLTLVDFAAELVNTRLFQFSEVNPTFDQNGQTAKLVAVAMYRICAAKR